MLRVGHCIHGLGLGGAQQVIRVLAAESDPAEVRHFVYSPEGGVLQPGIEAAGARVRIVPRQHAKLDLAWAGRLAAAMRSDSVDLVHGHLFGDSLHGYLAARRVGALPVVLTLHATFETLPLAQRLGYRWLAPRVRRVIACSRSVQRSFSRRFVGRVAPIEVIENGLPAREPAMLRAALGSARPVRIGAVGRLVAEKGYDDLIAAFARCAQRRDQDLSLVLIGEGELREPLERRAQALGVGDRVQFAGFRGDVGAELDQLDVVVFSSVAEALPMALLEAMAAARPIVATTLESFRDALEHERDGLLVPARDPAAMAEAILRLLGDPGLSARLATSARSQFLLRFSAARMVGSYLRVYRELRELRELHELGASARGGAACV